MALIDDCVTEKDGAWDFQCPVNDGTCVLPGAVPFTSSGWPTKTIAKARGLEHFAEHKGEGTASSLDEFRAKHGLAVGTDKDGQPALITAKDL